MESKVNNQIYDDLAETWWDENEFLHLLKVMVNPWRVPYFKEALVRRYGPDLRQVRLLDIGCGGGVLAEEFARMGCQVTGIDIYPRSIAIARMHVAKSGLSIDYRVGSGTDLNFDPESAEKLPKTLWRFYGMCSSKNREGSALPSWVAGWSSNWTRICLSTTWDTQASLSNVVSVNHESQ